MGPSHHSPPRAAANSAHRAAANTPSLAATKFELLVDALKRGAILFRAIRSKLTLKRTLIVTSDAENSTDEPLVVLVFDEAHVLTGMKEGKSSNFVHLRYELRRLRQKSLFFLFLSITGKLTQFVPLKSDDPSNRIIEDTLKLIEPFCDLGFDHFATKCGDGNETLEVVTGE